MTTGLKTLVLVLAIGSSFAGGSYKGYKVLRITPKSEENVARLMQLLSQSELDVWQRSRFPGEATDVMVSPQQAPILNRSLKDRGFNASVMIEDVAKLIEEENRGRIDGQLDNPTPFHWVGYHSIEKIHQWMRQKAQLYKDIANVVSAGKAVQGREILGLRIAHKPNLPIVFIEAGIHAREWITTAAATWFIRQVLTTADDVLKSYEWHIFPSVNPDGYDFTREVRLWRKSRAPPLSPGRECWGVDLNRNWPFEWQPDIDECRSSYPGRSPGSEPETEALRTYLNSVSGRTKVYIALHSYGQLLMYPWSYTTELPRHAERLQSVALKAVKRLASLYGTVYRTGPIATTIYPAFGTTVDYAYNLNITYAFAFELRDKEDGNFGFLMPKEYIIPTAQETLQALTAILEEAIRFDARSKISGV